MTDIDFTGIRARALPGVGELRFTRADEIVEYADEYGLSHADAIVALVNRALSLPDPGEPTFDEKLFELQGRIQAATDRAGSSTSAGFIERAIVDLGGCLSSLVSIQRRELRRGVER